jgi:hypothetical protein
MKVHREPTVGVPSKSLKDPVRFNVLTRKECGYTIRTACPLLAIQAMTQRNLQGVASTRDAKLLASAGRGSRHHGPSPNWVDATGYSAPRISKGSKAAKPSRRNLCRTFAVPIGSSERCQLRPYGCGVGMPYRTLSACRMASLPSTKRRSPNCPVSRPSGASSANKRTGSD